MDIKREDTFSEETHGKETVNGEFSDNSGKWIQRVRGLEGEQFPVIHKDQVLSYCAPPQPPKMDGWRQKQMKGVERRLQHMATSLGYSG